MRYKETSFTYFQGDSGSGMVCERSGVWYLTGVVSFGRGCGQAEYPGVNVRVQRYVTWIRNNAT